jgi:hypothetical protein
VSSLYEASISHYCIHALYPTGVSFSHAIRTCSLNSEGRNLKLKVYFFAPFYLEFIQIKALFCFTFLLKFRDPAGEKPQ